MSETHLNTYVAFYKGKQKTVQAVTSYGAQKIAAEQFKARHEHQVTVMLAKRSDGTTVMHDGAELP